VPVFTIIDALLAECVSEGFDFANILSHISRIFGQQIQDLLETYHNARQLTEVHKVMLFQGQSALRDYFLLASEQDLPCWVDRPDASGRSALAWAVEYGLLHCVETLLGAGADPNQRVGLLGAETSLLHSALAGPPTGKTEIVYIDISATLIRAGADVNAIDAEGWTPLHIAASWGSHKGIKSLAKSSFLDWGAVTQEGQTASQLAMGTADDKLISLLQAFENDVASR
jgi:ankyrin repeat protein